MEEIDKVRSMVQDAIDQGATTVEDVHKKIASMPLQALQGVAPLADAAKQVDDLSQAGIGAVYDALRTVNEQVGSIASQLLGGGKKPAD